MTPDIPATPSEADGINTGRNSRAGGPTSAAYNQYANRASTRAWNAVRQATWRPIVDLPINPASAPDERSPSDEPRFCMIFGTDIAEFGRRDQLLQDHVRTAMYTMLRGALTDSGLSQPQWRDRGDGAMLIVPYEEAHRMVDPFIPHLYAALRRYNRVSSEDAKIVLRTAMHLGVVYRDENGWAGTAIVRMCRLLDAPAFKDAVRNAGAALGLVVSQQLYETVIQFGPGLVDPDTYTMIIIENKETFTRAWLHLPSRTGAPL